jgi:peptidylprolyl isomerase
LQWADAKVGTGPEPKKGSAVSADYVMSTTGARYGSKIYGTAESGAPYRWVLGDNASTIQGLNEAVMGGNGIPPMRPGGIRRVFIPQNLAYASLGQSSSGSSGCDKGVGPVPPVPEAFEEFQRFKNIYCNPNRAYQPDIVLDIKLYGKRSVD